MVWTLLASRHGGQGASSISIHPSIHSFTHLSIIYPSICSKHILKFKEYFLLYKNEQDAVVLLLFKVVTVKAHIYGWAGCTLHNSRGQSISLFLVRWTIDNLCSYAAVEKRRQLNRQLGTVFKLRRQRVWEQRGGIFNKVIGHEDGFRMRLPGESHI